MTNQPLDAQPLWAIYFLTVLLLLAIMEAGYRLSRFMQRKSPVKSDAGLGTISGASLALLSFLLAYAVSFAANIFNERRQLVIQQAEAIGTTYLRAGYLDEPYRTEARGLLREYVDVLLSAIDPAKLETAMSRMGQIHNALWKSAESIARQNPVATISLYITSLNETIDLYTERLNAVLIRVPPTVLLVLYIVAFFTIFLVGMNSGYLENRNLIALVILVLILSVVLFIIVDLDRSQQGFLKVSQQAIIDLQRELNP